MLRLTSTLLLILLFLTLTPLSAAQLEDLQEEQQMKEWIEGSTWYKIGHMNNMIQIYTHLQENIEKKVDTEVSSMEYQVDDMNRVKDFLTTQYQTPMEIHKNNPEIGDIIQLKETNATYNTDDEYSLKYYVLKEIHQPNTPDEKYVLYTGQRCIYITPEEFKNHYTGLSLASTLAMDTLVQDIRILKKHDLDQYIQETTEELETYNTWNTYGTWLAGISFTSGLGLGGLILQCSKAVGTYILIISAIALAIGLLVYGITWICCKILTNRLNKLKMQEQIPL